MSVNNRVELARTLVHRLPATLTALSVGDLSLRHARLLVEAVAGLSDADAAGVEAAAVPFVVGRDYTAFARKVRREVLALDSRTVEQRAVHAIAERRVWCRPNQDSATATIGAVLPADGAQLLMTALDVAAEHSARHCGSDDARTLDQRRADALVQLAIDALTGYRSCTQGPDGHDSVVADDNTEPDVAGADQRGDAPRWHGARPRIQVSVALSTLLGLDDQPGELSGHGPIPATLARAVAGDPTGTWYRLITDAQGHLVDYGRTRYRPPAPLRDHVIARDCECQFPGCHRPAVRAEQDHVIAWADGGTTCADNLLALCLRHHHLKHDTTWTVQRIADGRLRWTSPTGRAYHREPATYPVDITASVVVVPDDNNETATPPAAA